jgi:hypothetical protein
MDGGTPSTVGACYFDVELASFNLNITVWPLLTRSSESYLRDGHLVREFRKHIGIMQELEMWRAEILWRRTALTEREHVVLEGLRSLPLS